MGRSMEEYRNLAEQYFSELTIAMSKATVKTYRTYLNNYFAHCEAQGLPVGKESYVKVLERMKNDGKSASYIRAFAASIKSYAAWLANNDYIEKNFTDGIKMPRISDPVPERMTREEAMRIFTIKAPKWSHYPHRDRAMLELLIVTGSRQTAIRELLFKDLDLANKTVTLRNTKRGKQLVMPLTDAVCQEIERYIEAERPKEAGPNDPLFVSVWKDGSFHPVDGKFFITRCRKWTQEACGRAMSPHKLRHTSASLQLEAGIPIEDISKNLGHSSLAMTARYARRFTETTRLERTAAVFAGFGATGEIDPSIAKPDEVIPAEELKSISYAEQGSAYDDDEMERDDYDDGTQCSMFAVE